MDESENFLNVDNPYVFSNVFFWKNKHLHMHSRTQISHAGIIFDADSEFKIRFPLL